MIGFHCINCETNNKYGYFLWHIFKTSYVANSGVCDQDEEAEKNSVKYRFRG